ncbi:tRNA (adenosine(37)-N6)-dimethylallyltransferase MiaA [Parasphingorhabdus sp.]|uniref:tRNA (adenosine(37)-N6)-dimethylallyltransferase MiaA n=1 Tax=Parasphingorhabdus sp. TaxID=2709688 RepID=UPI003D2799A3
MNMVSPKKDKNVILIVGPTASGKSALALELAKKQALQNQESVIINADSAQVYRDLQIVSARPTVSEMQGFEHQLYGYIDGAEACSAARWAHDAKTSISEAHDRGRLPILVGGTGLYVRTLLDGIAPIPDIDPEIRAQVRALEALEAYELLQMADPEAANRLNQTDKTRIQRALEVSRSTGKPLHHWQQRKTGGIGSAIRLHPLVLLPPRDWLYARCDQRFHLMIKNGAKQEVEQLLNRDLSPDCPVMRAIGVPEIAQWINGESDLETAAAIAQAATRQYAKRQYTWFRNQCPADWPRYAEIINVDNFNDIETLLQ